MYVVAYEDLRRCRERFPKGCRCSEFAVEGGEFVRREDLPEGDMSLRLRNSRRPLHLVGYTLPQQAADTRPHAT